MALGSKGCDAVSPVIGTILLVAVTMVLAAVITAGSLGLVNGFGSSYKDVQVGVSEVMFVEWDQEIPYAKMAAPYVNVIIYGGKDVGKLRSLKIVTDSDVIVLYAALDSSGNPQHSLSQNLSADSVTGFPLTFTFYSDNQVQNNYPVSIIGTFSDGTETILLKTLITYSSPSGRKMPEMSHGDIILRFYPEYRCLNFA